LEDSRFLAVTFKIFQDGGLLNASCAWFILGPWSYFVLDLRTLLGASPLLELDIKVSSNILGWLLCIPILSLILTGLVAMLRQGWKGSVQWL